MIIRYLMQRALPTLLAGRLWMFGRQLQQVTNSPNHSSHLTPHALRKIAEADGDSHAAAHGGGAGAAPVHRKTRI